MSILNDIMIEVYQDYEDSMIQFAEWKPPIRIEVSREVLYEIKIDPLIFRYMKPIGIDHIQSPFNPSISLLMIDGSPVPVIVNPNRKEGWEVIYGIQKD